MRLNLPKTIEWINGKVRMVNQLLLPYKLEYIETDDPFRVAEAIKRMEIRGAPAIGVAAAFGMALASLRIQKKDLREALNTLERVARLFKETRPTAINLFWAVNRMMAVARSATSLEELIELMVKEAKKIALEDEKANKHIGELGSQLLSNGDTVVTICNAGSLATTYYGTATAPIYVAKEKGLNIRVIAMETRPYLQGSRLTAFELKLAGIPVSVITDNQIGVIMEKERVDIVFVGADRVVGDGHVINKIGTYPLALVAREHGVPFYVAAPISTIDLGHDVEQIVIERRPGDEAAELFGRRLCPEGVDYIYYAFDITPPRLVTGIITERGIAYPPYLKSLKELVQHI